MKEGNRKGNDQFGLIGQLQGDVTRRQLQQADLRAQSRTTVDNKDASRRNTNRKVISLQDAAGNLLSETQMIQSII